MRRGRRRPSIGTGSAPSSHAGQPSEDGQAADEAIGAVNDVGALLAELGSYVYATVTTDSRDERAQALFGELTGVDARLKPLLARLADWVNALHEGSDGPTLLATYSSAAAEHAGPLLRLAARARTR